MELRVGIMGHYFEEIESRVRFPDGDGTTSSFTKRFPYFFITTCCKTTPINTIKIGCPAMIKVNNGSGPSRYTILNEDTDYHVYFNI